MGRPPSVFERHARVVIAALALSSVIAADFAFTFAYGLVRPGFHRERSAVRVRSPLYHHGFEPLSTVDDERWGGFVSSYRINSLGMRDATTRQVPLSASRPRVLLIGDSFTEGVGVAYERTFAGLTARALGTEGAEVLNAGVASYCPIIYLRRVRNLVEEAGLKVDHLVVFVDIADVQDEVTYALDEQGNVVSKERRRLREERANRVHGRPVFLQSLALRRFLDRHTLLLARLYAFADRRLMRLPRRGALWDWDDAAFEEYGREGMAQARTHMDALRALTARHGIGMTLAVYPWPDHLLLGRRNTRQETIWREWAAAKGVSYLDYFPRFRALGEPEEVVDRHYIDGDIHWNEAGHAVIAQALVEHLRSLPLQAGAADPAPAAR